MKNGQYEFNVEGFSGPLDLLLHLAKTNEIEITNISLDLLIEQYINYIEEVQESGLDIRSGYLEMAAELLRLKSLIILNYNSNLDIEIEDEEIKMDREIMINRLLEYKKYKEVVGNFNELIDNRSNFMTRNQDKLSEYREENFKQNFDINKFFLATKQYLKHFEEEHEERIISVKELNVEEFMVKLKEIKKTFTFEEVIKKITRNEFISLFLAVLESLKLQYISINTDDGILIAPYNGEKDE